ncbi:MAG: carboxypeptidase regulatory-like domain-containing protein [Acidobacteria bacterium]|nr:carboxypeptidase regulatory-like domain-containing protein [Acidobacteriota bacterium]MCW5967139.1 carboxypeptidase regulatory-like domain-containing protein [Blastocatellales bacterium]
MTGKFLRLAIAVCALTLSAYTFALAQVGRIEGDVKKAGTEEPIIGATIEIVRTDIRGNYKVTSDKKGHFIHAGVPYVGTYTLLVSADGYAPTYLAGIRPTGELMKIELSEGDGRKLTIDDVKALAGGARPGAAPASTKQQAEDAKKQQEEIEKIKASNEKIKADFENMKKSFEEGLALNNQKDYSGAITKFKEAQGFDPDQHVIPANLALALYNRGATQLNAGQRDAAKQDFTDAAAAAGQAIQILEPKLSDPAQAVQLKKSKVSYLKIKADAQSVLAQRFGDTAAAESAVKDYNLAAELSDVAEEKKQFSLKAAKSLYEAGMIEQAIEAYSQFLTKDQDNIEALYNLGLAYASVAKFQESANTLQRFVDKAPENDPRVAETKAVIKDLIVGNNLEPPKSDDKSRGRQPARRRP